MLRIHDVMLEVPAHETHDGKTVWDGDVQVIDLVDHRKAARAYALELCDRGAAVSLRRSAGHPARGRRQDGRAGVDRRQVQEGAELALA
jgi:hypothetical protein